MALDTAAAGAADFDLEPNAGSAEVAAIDLLQLNCAGPVQISACSRAIYHGDKVRHGLPDLITAYFPHF